MNKTNNVQIKIGDAQNGELGGYCSQAKKNRYKNEHEKVSWLVMASTGASHKHYYIKWYDRNNTHEKNNKKTVLTRIVCMTGMGYKVVCTG